MYARTIAGLTFLFALVCNPAAGHGPMHEQIELATQAIRKEPRNARLYLRRAELHRLHKDWPAARSDLNTAQGLDHDLCDVSLARARLLLDSGDVAGSIPLFDQYLAREPARASAHAERAAALAGAGRNRESAEGYRRAIAAAATPELEWFVFRSRALAAAGEGGRALASLTEGVQRLGPVVSLQMEALELERKLGRWDAALARVDQIAAAMPRKETWFALRAEVCEQAGRRTAAARAWREVLRSVEQLPAHLRGTKAISDLEVRARAGLNTPLGNSERAAK